MAPVEYHYSARPTRSPLRYLRAVWRLVRHDPSQETEAAAVVEIGFARSRLGRRFARWDESIAALKADPRTAPAMRARARSTRTQRITWAAAAIRCWRSFHSASGRAISRFPACRR